MKTTRKSIYYAILLVHAHVLLVHAHVLLVHAHVLLVHAHVLLVHAHVLLVHAHVLLVHAHVLLVIIQNDINILEQNNYSGPLFAENKITRHYIKKVAHSPTLPIEPRRVIIENHPHLGVALSPYFSSLKKLCRPWRKLMALLNRNINYTKNAKNAKKKFHNFSWIGNYFFF